mgnify:CR=1 FL=1
MANVSNLRIVTRVDDQATPALRKIRAGLDSLGKGQAAAGQGATGLAKAFLGVNDGMGMAAVGAGVAATAIIAVGAAAVAAGIRAGKAASAYNEALNKSQVLFGESARVVQDFAENAADALGMTSVEALDAAGSFGSMFRAIGMGQGQAADMSVAMAKLASDMASFNNVDPSEMLQKLQSGLAGEAEPLRRVGVFLSEAAVQQEAFRQTGKSKADQLTETNKVMARYALILRQTALQQGDFARTADSPANAMRRISAGIEDIFRVAGESLMPELEPSLKAVLDLLRDVREGVKVAFADPMTKEAIAALGSVFRGLIEVIRALLPYLGMLWRLVGPPITAALTRMGQALKMVADAMRWFSQLIKSVIDFFRGLYDSIKSAGGWFEWLKGLWAGISAAIAAAWEAFKGFIAWLLGLATDWVLSLDFKLPNIDWEGIWNNIKDILTKPLQLVLDIGLRMSDAAQRMIDWLRGGDETKRVTIEIDDKTVEPIKQAQQRIDDLTGRTADTKNMVPIEWNQDEFNKSLEDSQRNIDNVKGRSLIDATAIQIEANTEPATTAITNTQTAINAITGRTADAQTAIQIEANTSQAINAIGGVQSGLNALQDKTVTVTVNQVNNASSVSIPGGVNVTSAGTVAQTTQSNTTTDAGGTGVGTFIQGVSGIAASDTIITGPANNIIASMSAALSNLHDIISGDGSGGGVGYQMMAAGGIVMGPTPAIVGEAGPEAVIPLSQLGGMIGSGMNVTINVSGFEDGAGAGAAAADAFRRALGLQRRMPFATV